MSKIHETGHAKNVANFEDLANFCRSYGATYNPSKVSIELASLDTLLADSNAALSNVLTRLVAYNNATNTRQDVFANLKPLCTRLVSALHATDATDNTIADAKTANRKIQGVRAPKKKVATIQDAADETSTAKKISASRQSYDVQVENFNKLVEILATEPSYHPNEHDLKVSSLRDMLDSMRAANSLVSVITVDINNARIARNETLYTKDNCLYKVAGEVKKYLKSIFGTKNPNYKQVSKLQFKTVS